MTFTHIVNLKFQSRILPWARLAWPGSAPDHFTGCSCGWTGLEAQGVVQELYLALQGCSLACEESTEASAFKHLLRCFTLGPAE